MKVVIVEGWFLGAVIIDCAFSVISASIFRTADPDSHIIILNKEALLDVYLQLTWIFLQNYKIDQWQLCGLVAVHMIVLKYFVMIFDTLLSFHCDTMDDYVGKLDNSGNIIIINELAYL